MAAVNVTTTAQAVVPAEGRRRKGLLLHNNGAEDIYFAEAEAEATTAAGFVLAAGEKLVLDTFGGAWSRSIYARTATGTSELRYVVSR